MSFREKLLARVEKIRGSVPGKLDLRQNEVTVIVRTWTGARAGVGSKTDVETVITNAGYNLKVEELSSKDIVASNGVYQAGDVKIGPITPSHPLGGVLFDTTDPATTSTAREVFYRIEGPSFPTDGAYFKRVEGDDLKNFRFMVTLRRTPFQP